MLKVSHTELTGGKQSFKQTDVQDKLLGVF